jgi:beta-lactamase superfamily II metal-dependent hydrolase
LRGTRLEEGPKADEMEISLFGPGFGESIVAHLGDGYWMVVDSCLRGDKRSAPLAYLRTIGVRVEEQVRLVVASHWHNDHIGGISDLLAESSSARFACSMAMQRDEFLELVSLYGREADESIAVLSEFERAFEIANRPIVRAVADRCLDRDESSEREIYSLSPSDRAIEDSVRRWASLVVPQPGKIRIRADAPNEAAVVLWIRVKDRIAILGADLVERPLRGWSAIVSSSGRPPGLAGVFKVAHHGSSNADHPPVWQSLLLEDPVAILSPFVNGNVKLPKREDVARIARAAPRSYITAAPVTPNSRNTDSAVEKTAASVTRYRRMAEPAPGHIRLRCSIDSSVLPRADESDWRIELFGNARALVDVLSVL